MNIGCARAEELISRTISANASKDEEQALREHLAGCAECARKQARMRQVWALMGRLPSRASSELKLRQAAARAARPAFRPAWAIAAAAAALLAVVGTILFRPSPEEAPRTVDAPPAVESNPSPEPLQAKEERNRVVETLEAINREKEEKPAPVEVVPPAPERKEPVAEVKPKPEQPVVRTPEPVKPEAPVATPDPKPAPPAPQAPARETLPTAATVDRVQGEVYALVGGVRMPARADFRLVADEGLETVGKGSQAVLEYLDGTRVVLGADTLLSRITDRAAAGKAAPGKRIEVERGVVAAQVAKQPAAEPMIFATPHAEARVLGTRLSLHVTAASTRCEVKEGRVRFSRLEGGTVELGADQYAVAGKGLALAVKSAPSPKVVLREGFDRGRWQPVWSSDSDPGSGLKLAVKEGSLSLQFGAKATPHVSPDSLPAGTPDATKKALDQVARVAALGSKKDWPRTAALEIKQPFALSNETPLRLRAKLWQAQSDENRIVAIALNRGVPAQGLSLERRGATVQLWSEATQTALWKKEIPSAQEWESLELWISKDQVAIRREGLTLHSGPNPLKAKAVQVSLGAHARLELAQDGEARFDDIEISWMTKADFEEISK